MNIAYLSQHVDSVSGIGRFLRALGNQMIARGHEVHCVSQTCDGQSFRWHRVPHSHVSNGLDKLWYRLHEARVSKSIRAHIFHSMGVGGMAHIVSAHSCHRAGVDLASQMQSSPFWRRNWRLFDTLSLSDEHRLMTSESTRAIVAVSRLVRNQLLESYPIPPEKIVIVPNGIDVGMYVSSGRPGDRVLLRERLGISVGDIVLLFVGNEFARKGLKTLIEALSLLPGIPVRLIVAGADDPRPFQTLSARLGVDSGIRFLGTVAHPERLYAIADMFVLPTLYEPFGLVIVEAMAAGIPVITYRHAGAVEDFTDEREALLLEDVQSATELARRIRRLIEDQKLSRKIAQQGRQAVQSLDWNIVADRFADLYKHVAAQLAPTGGHS